MNLTTLSFLTVALLISSPREPWPAGLVAIDKPERLQRITDDIARADMIVYVRGDDQLDIGISSARVFSLDELRVYFPAASARARWTGCQRRHPR